MFYPERYVFLGELTQLVSGTIGGLRVATLGCEPTIF